MNIILLLSDTFRYDNLFDRAADMPVRTPNLDAFARNRAVSLTRMYTGSFPTIPQRTDMTSGRIGWPWYGWQSRTASSKNHLPVMLGKAGYATQLLCDCPHLFRANFDQGFRAAHVLRGQEGDVFFLRLNHPIERTQPPEKNRAFKGQWAASELHRWTNRNWKTEEDRFAPRTAKLAMEWLDENYKHHPFFLWVDWFDPHEPWDPPEEMVRHYDPDYNGTAFIHPNYGKASDLEPAELKNLRAHYCAEAEMVDRWIGRVLEKIDDLGLWDNSIVVFTTDHGICLGEHNRTGKSNINDRDDRRWPLYPEMAHIPFLVAAPGLQGGREVDELFQPADIAPTLAELAGVKLDPPEPMHGQSFAPLLRGESGEGRQFVVSAKHGCWHNATGMTPVLYTKRWAYVPLGENDRTQLFDLDHDGGCQRDVAAKHPDVAKELHRKLLKWLKEIGAPRATVKAFKK